MSEIKDSQEILNLALDKTNIQLKSVSKNGNKQFLQYYIDNGKMSQLLPIQVILNSIFDRQTSSICVSGSTDSSTIDLTNYSGNISISSTIGNNVISSNDSEITIGSDGTYLRIDAVDILFNGNNLNTANGLVKLNNVGKIDSSLIDLQYDPNNLYIVQDVTSLQTTSVQITIKNTDGTYNAITLQQLAQLCSPQLEVLQ